MESNQYFSDLHIKFILYQLLLGLKFIHSACIVHCDLKPEHILINESCNIQIGHFASACTFGDTIQFQKFQTAYVLKGNKHIPSPDVPSPESASPDFANILNVSMMYQTASKRIESRRYCAPEDILLQILRQNRQIHFRFDIWSVGCIFGELLQMRRENCAEYKDRKKLFHKINSNMNDDEQLRVVFSLIGTPHYHDAKYFANEIQENVKNYIKNLKKSNAQNLLKRFPITSKSGIELLTNMLTFVVDKRMTVEKALKSSYFQDVRNNNYELLMPSVKRFQPNNVAMEKLKGVLLEEICYYNPEWKQQLKQQYKQKQKELQKHIDDDIKDFEIEDETKELPVRASTKPSKNLVRLASYSMADPKEIYNLIKEIGSGEFGTVYKAENKKMKKIVAVKKIPHHKYKSINQEINTLAKCNSDFIIKFFGQHGD
eukprot:15143_1